MALQPAFRYGPDKVTAGGRMDVLGRGMLLRTTMSVPSGCS